MTKVDVFKCLGFETIRVAEINGYPWFCAKDICSALGYGNAVKATGIYVKSENQILWELGGAKELLISPSGVFSLVQAKGDLTAWKLLSEMGEIMARMIEKKEKVK